MKPNHFTASLTASQKGWLFSFIVLVLLIVSSWVLMALDIDLKTAKLFFSPNGGWTYKDVQPFRALYLYGTIPGLMLTVGALIIFFSGYAKPQLQPYQKPMLVIILTTLVGAGILVNGIIKPYCGRPRPREIIDFGGQYEFTSPCFNNSPGKGLSFPCGHCTMGFVFISLIYLRRQHPRIAYGGAAFGLFYGAFLGVTRTVQGAHFVTDTLWALGILVIVSLLSYYNIIAFFQNNWLRAKTLSPKKLYGLAAVAAVVVIVVVLTFLTRRPFYEMRSFPLPPISSRISQLTINCNVALSKKSVSYKNTEGQVALLGQGFGWPDADEKVEITTDIKGYALTINVNAVKEGYFAELQHQLFLTLPETLKDRIDISISGNK